MIREILGLAMVLTIPFACVFIVFGADSDGLMPLSFIVAIPVAFVVYMLSSSEKRKKDERKQKEKENDRKRERIRKRKEEKERKASIERNERIKAIEREEKIERKMNMDKLLMSWEADAWQDKTKSVIRTSAKLWGSYDDIHHKWNNKLMDLGFKEGEKTYWINVDYSQKEAILNPLGKEITYSVTVNITDENREIKLFYFENNWYYILADISFDDAVALITAEELREKQKVEREKQKLHREIERAKSLLNGEEVKRHRKSISREVQNFVWNRDGGKCVECGSNENLEFDHIIPFSKGGSDTARNLQLLCETCNRKKSNNIG